VQHVKRTAFQAVHCWSHCLDPQMPKVDPSQWAWCNIDEKWMPLWMAVP